MSDSLCISDSCQCGSEFEVTGYSTHSIKVHKEWRADHAECRKNMRQEVSADNRINPFGLIKV